MAFSPTPQDYGYYNWLKNFGSAPDGRGFQLTPEGYSIRTNFWSNVNEGKKLQARSKAVEGASDWSDLMYKEKIISPEYIAEQKKIEDKKIKDALDRDQAIFNAGIEQAKILQQIKDQEITFNEQTNSGDFNETPITDVNLFSGCSECTGTEISPDPILRKGYHTMPDGSLMKDSDMEKKPLNNNMKFAGIAAAGVIGLLLYTKSGFK